MPLGFPEHKAQPQADSSGLAGRRGKHRRRVAALGALRCRPAGDARGLAFAASAGHNLAALPVLLPPVIALLGVLATVFIVRTRYRVKHSLYKSVRQTRTRQIEEARRRALSAAGPSGESVTVEPGGETALEMAFGLISLAAALALVLMGVILAIGSRG